ncbi:hypothetical protein [Lactobacillus johnsonii]|uniref:Uncharacterized protein n=1 Tax=Lactobacillus johnsonii ATCC 33200 TaxID=525330 RepID=C2E5M1_LACJH|nr:hypothetical protein [Lactobacillus johnsonii]EEJ59781.1 hypothetical protein HMPREF0528_1168 [Lactobacillus johnsonii ATCC 33200]MCF0083453.1 hypothetical protein [Lactobacillus johnsonii]
MSLSPRLQVLLLIVEVFWITLDQETHSSVIKLGIEFIINQFSTKILTSILFRYA